MNKSDLIEELAQKTNLTPLLSEDIVNLIVNQMKRALGEGKRIEIRGFGSFTVKDYDSYWGRNPKSGEKIWVSAKRLPAFKLGKELRERLNSSEA